MTIAYNILHLNIYLQTPILWSHGISDPTVLFEAGQAGPPFLEKAGVTCEFKVYYNQILFQFIKLSRSCTRYKLIQVYTVHVYQIQDSNHVCILFVGLSGFRAFYYPGRVKEPRIMDQGSIQEFVLACFSLRSLLFRLGISSIPSLKR